MLTFCIGKGLGNAKFVQLQAVLEIAQRHLFESMWQGDPFSNPTETNSYLSTRLRGYTFEVFATLFLDNRHRALAFEELFRGTIDGANVHPREVVRRALHHNAAAIIAHYHPLV
jgi:DNA repair protein RadC